MSQQELVGNQSDELAAERKEASKEEVVLIDTSQNDKSDPQKQGEMGLIGESPSNAKNNRRKREMMYMDQQNILRDKASSQKFDRSSAKQSHQKMLNFFQKQKSEKAIDFKQMRKNLDSHRVPLEVEALFPNKVRVYERMREIEEHINQYVKQKIMNVKEDLLNSSSKVKRNLRVMVQTGQQGQHLSLRVEGRILNGMSEEQILGSNSNQVHFLNFLERLEVDFPGKEFPPVEWTKAKSDSSNFDSIEVVRKVKESQKTIRVNLRLYFESNPKKFKLSPELADILGIQEETRLRIIGALWQYIKSNRLQDSENREVLNTGNELLRIFGQDKLEFSSIMSKLQCHIFPVDPIELSFTFNFQSPQSSSNPTTRYFYNIPVQSLSQFSEEQIDFLVRCSYDFYNYHSDYLDQSSNVSKLALNGNVLKKREAKYNIKISNYIEKMKKGYRQMKTFEGLARNFKTSLQNLLLQQNKLLQVLQEEKQPVYDVFPEVDSARFFCGNQNWIAPELLNFMAAKEEVNQQEFQEQLGKEMESDANDEEKGKSDRNENSAAV